MGLNSIKSHYIVHWKTDDILFSNITPWIKTCGEKLNEGKEECFFFYIRSEGDHIKSVIQEFSVSED